MVIGDSFKYQGPVVPFEVRYGGSLGPAAAASSLQQHHPPTAAIPLEKPPMTAPNWCDKIRL